MTQPVVSTAAEWRASADVEILQVPSGNTCRARKQGMQAFVKAGMIPNSLLPIVISAMKNGDTRRMKDAEKDPQKFNDVIVLMDRIVVHSVVEPRVLPVPPQEDPESDKYDPDFEREEDALYVDEVDLIDKSFIFNWACGGTSDLEQFRNETEQLVDAAQPSEDVRQPAKRAAGAKRR